MRNAHRHDHPAGCGCSAFCATCGAVIAIVAALDGDRSQERDCVLTAERDGETIDLTFHVKATRIHLEGQNWVLVFLQDVTLTFVPKILAVGLTLIFAGHWMLQYLISFAHALFSDFSRIIG